MNDTLVAGADAPINVKRIGKRQPKGPTTIFAPGQLKAVRRHLIQIVADHEGRHKGAMASIWVDETNPDADADARKRLMHHVMTVIEGLLRERLIVERVETTDGGRTYHNLYPREYVYQGAAISISAILRLTDKRGKPLNVHGLSYVSVRDRLLKGLSVAEALELPPTGVRGGLAKALEDYREDDGLTGFFA